MIALLVVFLLIIIGFIIAIVGLTIDWRGIFQRYYGDDYRHGEAIQIINGKRTYFSSELWHEGPGACSYWRTGILNGKKVTFDDIVPNPSPGVPFQFDANGRRMYWLIPNNVIASNSENTDYQFTNYSPDMMSADMEDRVMSEYGHSVHIGSGGGIGIIVTLLIILGIVVGGILLLGRGTPPVTRPSSAAANTTGPAGLPPGAVIGIPVTPTPATGGGK